MLMFSDTITVDSCSETYLTSAYCFPTCNCCAVIIVCLIIILILRENKTYV